MLSNPVILLSLATFFSAIPIIIWLFIFFDKKEKSKKTVAFIFALGCLTAPALLGVQYIWDIFPNFNLSAVIEQNIRDQNTMFILTFILFGAMEEFIKMYVVKAVDEKTLLINKVNDAVKYSLVSALGFSFVENAYYLYQFWPSISIGELVGMYIFRSIFTTCAHMIFSGIFGYYYGIGKYSIVMTHHEKLTEGLNKTTRWIAKIFRLPLSEGFRQKTVLKGVIIAIGMHAAFNFLLQFNKVLPVIIFVSLGYLYLKFLLSRKAGHLILTDDITKKKKSTIAKKDSEVVIELMAMWFNETKYVDVLHVCERLLERDPSNNVVKLFKAKALDQMDEDDTYKKIIGTVLKTEDDMSEYDKNIINKYTTEKEEFEKAKAMIQKQLEKEGKSFTNPQKISVKTEEKPATETGINKYIGEGTFKI